MPDSSDWLAPQTKAQLCKDPPDKLAPPDVDGYSLVLLERGTDHPRVDHALHALADDVTNFAANCPFIVRRNLSLTEALVGQFELICCDSISIILRYDVVRFAQPAYLHDLYDRLRDGDEFAPVAVHLKSVPDDESGRRFLLQFFGQFLGVGATHFVARKKARIMAHWGEKLGASLEVDDPTS